MPIDHKNESRYFQKIVDIGAKKQFSTTEIRYLRVTNIASILGAMFMAIWMIIAIYLTDAPVVYGSNGLMGLLFLLVLVFNWKGWRVLASTWLNVSSYFGVLVFLYLLGYSSGVAAIYFILIIIPYMTFPQMARNISWFQFTGIFDFDRYRYLSV